jgi:Restriction endonuclease
MPVTRTLGPLHFEDLDPKRFEDLVRQLTYDFKLWRRLEATGRAGSDDGFDARGFEINSLVPVDDETVDFEEPAREITDDLLWLIQCKRERSIGPKALTAYLSDIKLIDSEALHGLLFVAACDFSKRSRDEFRAKCDELGVQEWHLWGKAELEDLLFQPKNDHLLFAYFGISLTIRRRTWRSQVRSKLSIKRKAKRLLDEHQHRSVLLRSVEDDHYPFEGEVADFDKQPPWSLYQYQGMTHSGLLFLFRRHFAYIDDTGKCWDATLLLNDADRHNPDNPWAKEVEHDLRQRMYEAWSVVPQKNQAWLEVLGHIPFENIVDIDEHGDDVVQAPHIYVQYGSNLSPFSDARAEVVTTDRPASHRIYPKSSTDKRITHFRDEWRKREGGESA